MSAFLKHWRKRKTEFRSIVEWWNEGKARVKRLTITHCVLKAKKQKRTQQRLSQELTKLKSRQRPDIEAVEEIEMRLNELDTAKAQGIQVQSRLNMGRERRKVDQIFIFPGKEKAT